MTVVHVYAGNAMNVGASWNVTNPRILGRTRASRAKCIRSRQT
jgi:hypothetical protein